MKFKKTLEINTTIYQISFKRKYSKWLYAMFKFHLEGNVEVQSQKIFMLHDNVDTENLKSMLYLSQKTFIVDYLHILYL